MVENKNNGNNGNNELDSSKSLNNSSNSNQSNQSNNSDSLNSDGFNNPNGNEDFGNDLQAQNKPINNGNSGKEGNGENKALEDGFDGNASQTAQTAKDAKTAEDNAKDAKDTAKDAASEASDAASDAAGAAGKGKVMTAFNVTDNLKASAQEAEAQDAEQSMKDVAKDTVKAAPKVAADAASGNVPGIVADAVDYASKTLPKLVKILPVLLLCVLLIGASIFSMVGMLPSVMYGGLEEKVEERQINKAQNVIEEEYEKRISAVVSDIIKQTKNEAEIGTFSAWKRIVAGKNDNYTVTVQRKNETDAVITVKNNKTSTGLKITVNQIYLTDYSPLKADKVALINSYAYKDAYKDTKEYLSGEAVPDETLFETTSNTKWRSKDTSGLKNGLKII